MQYRLQHFFEWFALNEQSIAELPNLEPDKQLFWLHWLDWHIKFYLSETEFMIFFPRYSIKPILYLSTGTGTIVGRELKAPMFSIFSLMFLKIELCSKAIGEFEECIIPDIEIDLKQARSLNPVTFVNMSTSKTNAYSRWDMAAMTIRTPELQAVFMELFPLVWIQLSGATNLNDRTLLALLEFDHYMDVLNRKASE